MTANIGSVVPQTFHAGFMEGRARSERRDMRGPEFAVGAAMRVRRWVGWWSRAPLLIAKTLRVWERQRREESDVGMCDFILVCGLHGHTSC